MSSDHFQHLPALQLQVRVTFLTYFRQTLCMAVQNVWAFVLGPSDDGVFFCLFVCFVVLLICWFICFPLHRVILNVISHDACNKLDKDFTWMHLFLLYSPATKMTLLTMYLRQIAHVVHVLLVCVPFVFFIC